MGLFDLFGKKKESSYDATNIKITDIDKNFIFEYDLKTWQVLEVYIYDWGNNDFSKEYKVSDGNETLFLSVEEDDELEICLSEKLKIRALDDDIPEYIERNEKPPRRINYKGKSFLLDDESPGYFKNADDDDNAWAEFIVWDYYDENDEYTISIEQWDANSFEASFGKIIKDFEISNIIPAEKK